MALLYQSPGAGQAPGASLIWRVVIPGASQIGLNDGPSFAELELFDALGTKLNTPASGSPVSSASLPYGPNRDPAAAFDGNGSTYTQGTFSDAGADGLLWLGWEFNGAVADVRRIDITSRPTFGDVTTPGLLRVEKSIDGGVTWDAKWVTEFRRFFGNSTTRTLLPSAGFDITTPHNPANTYTYFLIVFGFPRGTAITLERLFLRPSVGGTNYAASASVHTVFTNLSGSFSFDRALTGGSNFWHTPSNTHQLGYAIISFAGDTDRALQEFGLMANSSEGERTPTYVAFYGSSDLTNWAFIGDQFWQSAFTNSETRYASLI